MSNMAIGHSIVEIKREEGVWKVVQDSPMNRRITLETPMAISGPLAGHDLMKTSYDPDGHAGARHELQLRRRRDPLGHGADLRGGGVRHLRRRCREDPQAAVLERYGYDGSDYYGRARFEDRFNVEKEPNEPNRFDWVVEIDPYDARLDPGEAHGAGPDGA